MTDEIRYVEGYWPGAIGAIAGLHGSYYATQWTRGCSFEATVARDLADFCEAYVAERDLLLTAFKGDRFVGAVAIDGSQRHHPGGHLRWFIVDPDARGLGIGRTLAERAVRFSRESGLDRVSLWTVEGLPESRRIYDAFGFQVVERLNDDRYSAPLEVLRMELVFE